MVCSYGEGQGLRGARNDKHRPGLIIADDLENTDQPESLWFYTGYAKLCPLDWRNLLGGGE